MQNIMKQAMSNPADLDHEVDEVSNIFESMASSAPQPQTGVKQQRVVECECCGAKNTIAAGEAAICKYCGNGLEG
jgi:hypothetical protein